MRRPWHVHVTLTNDEHAVILAAAKAEGRPVANYIKFHALDAAVTADISALRRAANFRPSEVKDHESEPALAHGV